MQTTDIDLNNASWTPIGSSDSTAFRANYNGGDFCIVNLYPEPTTYVGLFGIATNAYLTNIDITYSVTKPLDSGTLAGGLLGYGEDTLKISNCVVRDFSATSGSYVGGLVGRFYSSSNDHIFSITNSQVINFSANASDTDTRGEVVGGLVGSADGPCGKTSGISNCIINNISIVVSKSTFSSLQPVIGGAVGHIYGIPADNILVTGTIECPGGFVLVGGAFGSCGYQEYSQIISYVNISIADNFIGEIGGIIGDDLNVATASFRGVSLTHCQYLGTISGSTSKASNYELYLGGIVGYADTVVNLNGCSFDGDININLTSQYSTVPVFGGLVGYIGQASSVSISCCTVNGSITMSRTTYSSSGYVGAVYGNTSPGETVDINKVIINTTINASYITMYDIISFTGTAATVTESYYNSTLFTSSSSTCTALTSDQMRESSSFVGMTDFDDYFMFIDNRNNGFPIVKGLVNHAKVTGFDGSGTESDPYQIKTTADLQGMQAYYNEYDLIDEYYWILVNDIDISTDANGLTINWCPIGYEGGVMSGFNGHFDGNGKIISGLTITAQYENVGLFGRMASNATITNLNVNGTILWDQATNVGGVVGLIEDGATLTNCTFNGTITGYLNSGNYAVVGGLAGKYSMDAITGIANYDAYVYGTSHYTTFERFNTTYTTT